MFACKLYTFQLASVCDKIMNKWLTILHLFCILFGKINNTEKQNRMWKKYFSQYLGLNAHLPGYIA